VDALLDLILSVADDMLLRGHRNSDWTGLAPILEEDIAFSALAQDDLAHASALYEFVAPRAGKSPDALALGRAPREYRSSALYEPSDEFDWAAALLRQALGTSWDVIRLERLARGTSNAPLAALSRRILSEATLARDHAERWIERLGADTVARQRLQHALDRLIPVTADLTAETAGAATLAASGEYPPHPAGDERELWKARVCSVMGRAGLTLGAFPPLAADGGGRRGIRGPALDTILDEMAEVYRSAPDAAW